MRNEKVLEYVKRIRNNNIGKDGLNQIPEQMTDDVIAENIIAEQKKSGNSKVAAALKELLKSGKWAIRNNEDGNATVLFLCAKITVRTESPTKNYTSITELPKRNN